MPMSMPGYSLIRDLYAMTDEEFRRAYRAAFQGQEPDLAMPSDRMMAFILEFNRREAIKTNRTLMRINWAMFAMTLAICIMTAAITWATFR